MIGKIIFSIGVFLSSLFGYHQVQPTVQSVGTFTPVQASQFTLSGSGVSSSATTIQLNSFTLPDPNRTPITMSMFGDKGYAVIDPQTSKIENITFTGVTQNANGTALLTGVSRGISFYSPYNASSTLALSHSGGSYLILTNSAAFYGKEFLFANNTGTSTSVLVFSSTTQPRYDVHPASFTLGTQLIDKTYADALSFAGVATSTESSFGGVWLATQLQQASSTNGSPNSPYVLQSRYATSTPGNSTSLDVVVTQNNGKIHQGFLDLTQAFSWSGLNTFTGGLTSIVGNTQLGSTSIPSLNIGVITSTSTASTVASSTITNLVISNNASTTNLTVSSACVGCPTYYTASSTAFAVSSGSVTYTGAIPTLANIGIGVLAMSGDAGYGSTVLIMRTGMTSAIIGAGSSAGTYTFSWSGNNLVVSETVDGGTGSGTIYWYR